MLRKSWFLLIAVYMLALVSLMSCSKVVDTAHSSESAKTAEADTTTNHMAVLYEQWIERMDPYVAQTASGEYVFDEAAFSAQYTSLQADEKKVYQELKDGLVKVNAEIGKHNSGEQIALGSWCGYYWWGKRCCYWGSEAHYWVMVMAMGGTVPGIGWGLAIYAAWAEYHISTSGGFCFNRTWAGGVWITGV